METEGRRGGGRMQEGKRREGEQGRRREEEGGRRWRDG
jgi:hypothetical protein